MGRLYFFKTIKSGGKQNMHWLILHWITIVVLAITTIVIYMATKSVNNHRTIYEMLALLLSSPEELSILSREDLQKLYRRIEMLRPPFIFKDRLIFQVSMVKAFKLLDKTMQLKQERGSKC
jgi:hypothetical protein